MGEYIIDATEISSNNVWRQKLASSYDLSSFATEIFFALIFLLHFYLISFSSAIGIPIRFELIFHLVKSAFIPAGIFHIR